MKPRPFLCLILPLALLPTLAAAGATTPDRHTPYPVPAVAPSATALVPQGWRIAAAKWGDLNGDKRSDIALVLKSQKEGEDPSSWDQPRLLVVALRGKDGLLHRSIVSDKVILTHGDGGVFGDPFAGITIRRGILVIDHYGGSRDRWSITNRYRLQGGEWIHLGTTATSSDTLDPTYVDTVDTNLLNGFSIHSYQKGKTFYRHLYYTLRAGNAARPPDIYPRRVPDDWPGPVVHLPPQTGARTAANGVLHKPSITVSVVTSGDSLYVLGSSRGSGVGVPTTIRIVTQAGRKIRASPLVTWRTGTGWNADARFSLRSLGVVWNKSREGIGGLAMDGENGISSATPLTVEIACGSAHGHNLTMFSTSLGRYKYGGVILFCSHSGLPRLGDDPLFP